MLGSRVKRHGYRSPRNGTPNCWANFSRCRACTAISSRTLIWLLSLWNMGLRFASQTAILHDFAVCVGLIRSHPEHGQEAIFVSFVCANESSGLLRWQGRDGEWDIIDNDPAAAVVREIMAEANGEGAHPIFCASTGLAGQRAPGTRWPAARGDVPAHTRD